MTEISIVIVGAGPRALNVIERLSWKLRQYPALGTVHVHLIDPGVACAGTHQPDQSRLLLTNTLASQVTMFSSVDPEDALFSASGPSFTEWAVAAGYRRFGSEYSRATESEGEPIGELDYLPRAMLGEYLAFSYEHILKQAPEALRVTHHRQRAMDVRDKPDAVLLQDGSAVSFDALILATGHSDTMPGPDDLMREAFVRADQARNPRLTYIRSVYPTSRLAEIGPGVTVAVQGLGLTAYDVIAELTLGRGGSFEGENQNLRYHPSGREPRILLFSRQSLPYNGRGVNQKGVNGGYTARFLTASAVHAIRARRKAKGEDGRIDFVADIMPLLKKDMAFGYRCAKLGRDIDPASFEPSAEEEAIINRILMSHHLLRADTLEGFRNGVISHLREDLVEALKGNMASPLKAATDTIRDLRAGLAAAIEFGGLLPDSHRFVVEHFITMTNRVTFGPPLRRNAELLALIDAGIVDWAGGPGATIALRNDTAHFAVQTPFPSGTSSVEVDALVIARVTGHRPRHDVLPLSRNMIARGLARTFRNGEYEPYGLDVDRTMRMLRPCGLRSPNAWAIGYVVEGPRFHTHALPRPGRNSTQLDDAKVLVDDLVAAVAAARTNQAVIVDLTPLEEAAA